AEWSRQIECTGGFCDVDARLQSLMETSVPPASVFGHQSVEEHQGVTDSGPLTPSPYQSQAAMEAQRLRQQAEALEERARQETEAHRIEQERREQKEEERERLSREQK